MDPRQLQLISLSDQVLATLRDQHVDIARIAEHGPEPDDCRLVQQICCYIMGVLTTPD